ncbi:hypothetical protein [Arenibaculum pallidiluteum]|uniref:hypothetical protein n=1 Tax=Arenibaculum pallidiluteum TaxID=2812559 RepID=UPI001A975A04|nr:hypothetical protein [Arenibaculum pallidiluteum]
MDPANPTLDELRAELRRIWRVRLGGEGRLSFTLAMEPGEPCHLTHWVRPAAAELEDCRAVGSGSPAQCLDALERYGAAYRRRPTEAEIAAMLGLS